MNKRVYKGDSVRIKRKLPLDDVDLHPAGVDYDVVGFLACIFLYLFLQNGFKMFSWSQHLK